MLTRSFDKNPVLTAMEYIKDVLHVEFKKGQIRSYDRVPAQVAYGLFYTTTHAAALSYYSNNIKGKYTVLTVKNK